MSLSELVVPVLLCFTTCYALGKRVDVYTALTRGAEEGLNVLVHILPSLIALLTAVYMFRASGAMEYLGALLAPALERVGIPPEVAPLLFIRPISGSGALAVGSELMATYGPDSYIGRVAAVMLGSSETTFYTIAVYFGSVGILKTRYTIPASLCADAVMFLTSAAAVRSRVTNVAEHLPERVTLPEFRRILLENILRENPGEEYPLTPDDLAAVEKLRAERYATWEWNYGRSPACTMLRRRRVDGCGLIEAYITVEHGLVSAVTFKGDFFSAEEPEALAARFVGHTPDRAGYTAALDGVETARYFAGLQADELIDILCEG